MPSSCSFCFFARESPAPNPHCLPVRQPGQPHGDEAVTDDTDDDDDADDDDIPDNGHYNLAAQA